MRIDVCVASYKRPEGLRRLLQSLRSQRLPDEVTVGVIVVDNDRNETARPVVDEAIAQGQAIVYDVEPEQNIALARNRSLSHSQADFVAFIDDDEFADPHWLAQLKQTAEDFDADVVFGPVVPLLPDNAPRWVVAGRFFERPRQKTGDSVRHGRTSNALVRCATLAGLGKAPFDPLLGLTGGSDFAMFRELRSAGARLVWCDDAAVTEEVPDERLTARWLVLRAFRGGQIFATRSGSRPQGVALFPWGLQRVMVIFGGALLAILVLPVSRVWAIRAILKASGHLGQLMSLTSYRYHEYASR